MLYFSNVEIIEPTGIKWSSIRFQRNNQTYRMLVSICQLIIEGMLITTDSGDYRLASFVDEQRMCRLYEKFILEYYSRHYPELSVSASQIPWSLDDGIGTMLPVMQSDIHLQRGNTVLIILLMRNTIATLRRSSLINILFIQITCIRFSPM